MRLRWINGVTGSIIAFAIGALFLAGGIYGFAEHSAPKVSQTIDWSDWLCIGVICIGVILLGSLVMETVRRTRAMRSRERHTGR
jgi:formate-dependent nitrite reductase membrane component NrfD